MVRRTLAVIAFLLSIPAFVWGDVPILGSWQFKNEQLEVVAEFLPDGTFRQVTSSRQGRQALGGRYQMSGQVLSMAPQGGQQAMHLKCRFTEPTPFLSRIPAARPYDGIACSRANRQGAAEGSSAPPGKPAAAVPPAQQGATAGPAVSAGKRPTVMLQRISEPNEKAFTFLVPKGGRSRAAYLMSIR